MAFLSLTRTRDDASIQTLVEAIWPFLTATIRASATGKAASAITAERLEDARERVIASVRGDRLEYSAPSPAGLTNGSQAVIEHWLYLATVVLRPQLDASLADAGFAFDADVPSLESALARAERQPFVVLDGAIHGISTNGELFADEDVRVQALTKAQRKRVEEIATSRRCECPMCVSLRKKLPRIDVAKLKRDRASWRHADSLGRALSHPDVVESLHLEKRRDIADALMAGLGKLRSLSDLHLAGSDVVALPESIGDLRRLARIDVSRTPMPALPDAIARCPLEALRADESRLVALPASLGDSLIEKITLGFAGLPPAPDGFLTPLSRMPALESLELFGGRAPFDDESQAELDAKSAVWARQLETISFATSSLRTLRIHAYPLERIPACARDAPKLETLQLQYCTVRELAPLRLPSIRSLEIPGDFTEIPSWIGELRTLRHLSLWGRFETVPDAIFDLPELEGLALHGRLTEIPESIGRLRGLRHLWLGNNPLRSLPRALEALPALELLALQRVENAAALAATLSLSSKVRVAS